MSILTLVALEPYFTYNNNKLYPYCFYLGMYYDYDTSIKGKTADGEDDLFLNQQIGSYILKGKLLRLFSNFSLILLYG